MTVRLLSFHVPYHCRHSGACCTAGWPIPVEPHVHRALAEALSTAGAGARGKRPIGEVARWVERSVDAPGGDAALMRTGPDGACVCFEKSTRLCAIHRRFGQPHLPSACRHFPRVVLHDARACHVSLSHFCPTAAAMLDEPGSSSIVEDPDGWSAELEGLDAREALPPLLRPDMLADFEGWDALERRTVAHLLDEDTPLGVLLERFARIVEHVRTWEPGQGALAGRVIAAFGDAGRACDGSFVAAVEHLDAVVRSSLTPGLDAAPVPGRGAGWLPAEIDRRDLRRPVRRFLAAHAFASWTAYQGRGVRTWARSILAAYAVLSTEASRLAADRAFDVPLLLDAAREADRLLRHLVSPDALARHLSSLEGRSLLEHSSPHPERNR